MTFCLGAYAAKPQPIENKPEVKSAVAENKRPQLDRVVLVDPTRPLGYSAKGSPHSTLKLQAIFFGDDRKEAIINGRSVKEGDSIQGKRIVKIRHDAIVIEKNGGLRTLVLRPSIFKQ
ncbi:MAG: hypothetical protein K6L80_06015 [Agarilytica sp.]